MPTASIGPAVWDLAIARLVTSAPAGPEVDGLVAMARARDAMGTRKYGTRLRPHDGRSSLVDSLQEKLDDLVYLEKGLAEGHDTEALIDHSIAGLLMLYRLLVARGLLPGAAPPPEEPYAVGDRLVRFHDGVEVGRGEITNARGGRVFVVLDGYVVGDWHDAAALDRLFRRDPHEARAPEPQPALRVGMTWEQTRDFEKALPSCTGSACLDDALCDGCSQGEALLCACGDQFLQHDQPGHGPGCGGCSACKGFSLASWKGGPPLPVTPRAPGKGSLVGRGVGEIARIAGERPATTATEGQAS